MKKREVIAKITPVQVSPEWEKKIAMEQEMNAKTLGISVEEYRDIDRGYLLRNIKDWAAGRRAQAQKEALQRIAAPTDKALAAMDALGIQIAGHEDHKHRWRTRHVAIEGVDCASGMACECGGVLDQDEVEELVGFALSIILDKKVPASQGVSAPPEDEVKIKPHEVYLAGSESWLDG